MPRYFFHILNANSAPVPDDEGAEFKDRESAKHEAVESVRDLVADAVRRGAKIHSLAIEIVDESGKVLDTIRSRDLFD